MNTEQQPQYRKGLPKAAEVLENLPQASSPMDLLNKIVAKESNIVVPNNTLAPTPVVEPTVQSTESKDIPQKPQEQLPEPVVKEVEVSPDILDIPDEDIDPKAKNIAENFVKLRTSAKETKKLLKEREEELERLRKETEDLKTGVVVPDFVREKEARIKELEKFEKIYSLETSPEYVETFIKPAEAIKEKIFNAAKEYEIPKEVMEEALTLDKRDLSRFLSEHFEDLDALEVKRHVEELRDISLKAKEARNDPVKAIEDMQKVAEASRQLKQQERIGIITTRAKTAFERSLEDIRKEGKAIELIPRSSDSEFNKNYVEPITQAAATEYAKIVKLLAENGLEDLPEELAYALANMTQRAHASAVAHETRNKALDLAEELYVNTRRTTRYERPMVGVSQGGSGNGVSVPKRETRDDRINSLIEAGRAMAKR